MWLNKGPAGSSNANEECESELFDPFYGNWTPVRYIRNRKRCHGPRRDENICASILIGKYMKNIYDAIKCPNEKQNNATTKTVYARYKKEPYKALRLMASQWTIEEFRVMIMP
ncbi:hypothetical protein V6N13_034213 [Hibiscus sabdariffa]